MAGIKDFARSLSSVGGEQVQAMGAKAAGSSGTLGQMIDKMTESTQQYHEAVKKLNDAQNEVKEAEQAAARTKQELIQVERQRRKVSEKIHKTEKALAKAKKEGTGEAKQLKASLEKLNKTSTSLKSTYNDLSKSHKQNNAALEKSQNKYKQAETGMDNLNNKGGILQSTLGILQSKTAMLGVAMMNLKTNLDATDQASKMVSSTMLRFQGEMVGTGGFTGTIKDLSTEAFALRGEFASFRREMAGLGVSGEDAMKTFQEVNKTLREHQGGVKATMQETMELAKQSRILGAALGIDTSEAIQMTTNAVDRYGMTQRGARDALAELHSTIIDTNKANEDAHMRVEDVTRAVQKAGENTQGFALNMRFLGNTMTQVTAQAQEQGATYAESLKIAESLTNLITGQQAPEWASWRAGGKIMKEFESNLEAVSGDAEKATERILEKHGEGLDEQQREHFRKNTEAFLQEQEGMNEKVRRETAMQLMQQHEMGAQALLDSIRDQVSGMEDEGLQTKIIQQAFPDLDMMSAHRVRRMIVDEGLDFEEMGSDIKGKLDETSEKQKSPMQRLEEKTGKQLAILEGTADKGITEVIKNQLSAVKGEILTSNEFLGAIQMLLAAQTMMPGKGGLPGGRKGGATSGAQAAKRGRARATGAGAPKGGKLGRLAGRAAPLGRGAAALGRLAGPAALAMGAGYGLQAASQEEGAMKVAAFGEEMSSTLTFGLSDFAVDAGDNLFESALGMDDKVGKDESVKEASLKAAEDDGPGAKARLMDVATGGATAGLRAMDEKRDKAKTDEIRKDAAPRFWNKTLNSFDTYLALVRGGGMEGEEAAKKLQKVVDSREKWLQYIDGADGEIKEMKDLLRDADVTKDEEQILADYREGFKKRKGKDMTREEEKNIVAQINKRLKEEGAEALDFDDSIISKEQDRKMRSKRKATALQVATRFGADDDTVKQAATKAAEGISGVEDEDILNLIEKDEENKEKNRREQKDLYDKELPDTWDDITDKIRGDISSMVAMNTMMGLDEGELNRQVRRGRFVETGAMRSAARRAGASPEAIQQGVNKRGQNVEVVGDGANVVEKIFRVTRNWEGETTDGPSG